MLSPSSPAPSSFAFLSTMTKRFAAIAQLTSTNHKLSNLMSVAQCAHRAIRHQPPSCMLFLPECFGFLGSSADETLRNAENLEDYRPNEQEISQLLREVVRTGQIPSKEEASTSTSTSTSNDAISIMDGLKTIARESGLWISGGGIHEANAPPQPSSTTATENPRVYNTHVILNEHGELVDKYRKLHLFDVSIPGKFELRESRTTAPGDELGRAVDSPLGRLGLSTCYDLRFPELYLSLRQRGARVLLVPSAFTVPTGTAHWHVLLRARAIEQQAYVLAAAQVGRHNQKRESYGHALAVSPWGEVVGDAGKETNCVVMCEVDMEVVESIEERMPIEKHREMAEKAIRGEKL